MRDLIKMKENPDMIRQASDTRLLDSIVKNGEQNPKVKETDFRRFILPLLLEENREDYSFWLEIAGTWYRGIDVTDDAGVLLFKVPPLLKRFKTRVEGENDVRLADQLERAERQLRTLPSVGASMIIKAVSEAMGVANNDEDIKNWRSLFAYYNIDFPETENQSGSKRGPSKLQADEYEEL